MEFEMKQQKYLYLILLFSILGLMFSCTAIKLIRSSKITEPTIKFVKHNVGKPTDKKVTINLDFDAHNPNKIGLKNIFVNYELFIENKRFMRGDNVELSLAPHGKTKIMVPVEIIYQDIFNVAGDLVTKILRRDKSIKVLAKITIFGEPTVYNEIEEGALFSFKYKTSKEIIVPIEYDKIKQAEAQVKNKIKTELEKFRKLF